jgi:hypothetical protein
LLVLFQLSSGISNDFSILHQNIAKSLLRSITIYHKVLVDIR